MDTCLSLRVSCRSYQFVTLPSCVVWELMRFRMCSSIHGMHLCNSGFSPGGSGCDDALAETGAHKDK